MKRLLRSLFRLLLLALVILAGVFAVNTISFSSHQVPVEAVVPVTIPAKSVARLSEALRIPTITYSPEKIDSAAFKQLDALRKKHFPDIDSVLETQYFGHHSVLIKWSGRRPDLPPVLLLAHQDVVPVEAGTEAEWSYPPFSGQEAEGAIWGRGALDDKSTVWGVQEAISLLIQENYRPERTLYLALGHDEEVGGHFGAKAISEYFRSKDIQLEYILDEGQLIVEDAIAGLAEPLALIGIAEKGDVTLRLSLSLENGGHSMMPPEETAISILSNAIVKLERHPFPGQISGASKAMFEYIGPEMSLPYKVLFANQWLTENMIVQQLSKDPTTNAMLRTTVSPTMIEGGVKSNVLPTRVSAIINLRILPGETIASTQAYITQLIADDRIKVEVAEGLYHVNPAPVSSTSAFGFQVIQKSIQQIFSDVVVAPGLVIASTDSRHFHDLSSQIYRFMPLRLTKAEIKSFHGKNEHIRTENYKQLIQFYYQLILNSTK